MRVRTSPRSRKATVLMVKHRAANLTYCCTVYTNKMWPQPFYGYQYTMVSVRAALKELYVLKHIIAVIVLLLIV